MTLKLVNVTKCYKQFTTMNGIDFTIDKGEIFGLIGQSDDVSHDFEFAGDDKGGNYMGRAAGFYARP